MRARSGMAATALGAVAALALALAPATVLPATAATSPATTAAVSPTTLTYNASTLMCAGYNGYHTLNPTSAVLAGKVRVGGRPAVVLAKGGNVAWNAKPFPSDYSWRVWFHSLKWTGDLIQIGQGKGAQSVYGPIRDTALSRAVTIAVDYLSDKPVGRTGDATLERASMAGRVQVFACLIEALRDRGWSVPPKLMNGAIASATRLASYPRPYYDNKALDADLAIFTVGCTLGRAGASMTDLGGRRIIAGMSRAIDGQGATNEQAPSYGLYTYKLFRTTAERMRLCGVEPPTGLSARLQAAATFLSHATTPNGLFAEIGDTASGSGPAAIVSPELAAGTPLEFVRSGFTQGTPPPTTSAVYSAGFAFGRSGWSRYSSWYSLRFGKAREAHGHFDHTSVLYSVDGRKVLVEAGHSGYNNAALRLAQRMPEGHNVVVDETASMSSLRQLSAATLKAGASGDGWESYLVVDNPYATRTGPKAPTVLHKRTRALLVVHQGGGRPDAMLVYDTIGAGLSRTFAQYWRVPAGSAVTALAPGKVRARTSAGDTLLQRLAMPGKSLPPTSSMRTVSGLTSKSLGSSTAAPIVKFVSTGRSAQWLTAIVPTGVGVNPTASTARDANGSLTVTVTAGGSTVTAVLGSDGLLRPVA